MFATAASYLARMTRTILLAALSLALAGCSGATVDGGAGDDESSIKPSTFSKQTTIVGTLSYGQTSAAVSYTKQPTYRAFRFAGSAGDRVDVWVRSANGDAMAWLLDHDFNTLATNDNAASGVTDAHLTTTLTSSDSSFYIAFREHARADATFTIALANGAPGPTPPATGKAWQQESFAIDPSLFRSDGTSDGAELDQINVSAVYCLGGSSASDVYACVQVFAHYKSPLGSSHDTIRQYKTLARRAPNGTWMVQHPAEDVVRLWGSGPHDVYMVAGFDGIYHSTGNDVWTRVWDQNANGYHDEMFTIIGGSGPADVWVVGGDVAIHFDGHAWTTFPLHWQNPYAGEDTPQVFSVLSDGANVHVAGRWAHIATAGLVGDTEILELRRGEFVKVAGIEQDPYAALTTLASDGHGGIWAGGFSSSYNGPETVLLHGGSSGGGWLPVKVTATVLRSFWRADASHLFVLAFGPPSSGPVLNPIALLDDSGTLTQALPNPPSPLDASILWSSSADDLYLATRSYNDDVNQDYSPPFDYQGPGVIYHLQ